MNEILKPEQSKYLNTFVKESDALLKEIESFAEEKSVPILYRESAEFLEQLITIRKPKRVLEIGTAIAYSSIRIARCLGKKSILHTIEKSKDNIKLAKKYIEKSGEGDKIKLLEGNALEIMPSLEKKYDFIFLDADKTDYITLFDYSLPLLKKNGIIFIDNLLWHGLAAAEHVPAAKVNATNIIREFNKMFTANKLLKTVILPIGDGVGIGIKINSREN